MKSPLPLAIFILTSVSCFAQWEPDVRLTSDPNLSRTSTSCGVHAIAASGNSLHIVWYDNRDGNNEIYYKRSVNGGESWEGDIRLTTTPNNSRNPSLAVSGSVVHVVWAETETVSKICYMRSPDGGNTWSDTVHLTNPPSEFAMPGIAASGSAVHVIYYQNGGGADIYYSRSVDGGLSWDPQARLTFDGSASYFPSICANGPVLHISWYDNRDGNLEIYYKRSLDAGSSWGSDVRLTNTGSDSWHPVVSTSVNAVHICFMDDRDGNYEIYHKRSVDGGTTWGAETRLTNNAGESWNPNLAAYANGTGLFLVWEDESDGNYEIYYKSSLDEGVNWEPEIRLTNDGGQSSQASVAVSGGSVNVAWYDTRNGNDEIYYKRDPQGAAMTADFSASPTGLCPGDMVQFTDLTNWNPTQWTWTFPGGSPETSTLQNPQVTYATAGSYDVSLYATNGYIGDYVTKSGYIQVFADTLSTPAEPTGNAAMCQAPPPMPYATTGSPGATSYVWQIDPPAAGVVNGNGTTVDIDWADNFSGTAQVSVKAVNICTESGFSTPLQVQIYPSPASYNMTGGGTMCEGGTGLEIGLDDSDIGVEYSLFNYGTFTGNTAFGNGSAISFGLFDLPGIYTSTGTDTATLCEHMMNNGILLEVIAPPQAPGPPVGPDSVNTYFTLTSEYITTGSPEAESYEWLLAPQSAGTVNYPDTTTVQVSWNPSFLGLAELSVRGVNDCGPGAWSGPLVIYVENTVGLTENTGAFSLLIYPNPNTGSFNLILQNQKSGLFKIDVTNTLGKTIYTKTIRCQAENIIIPVHIIEYPPGIYLLQAKDQTGNCLNKKIVKKE